MSEYMQEAEKQGQVNRLEISGKLLSDVTSNRTPTGKEMLKTRLMVYQGEKKERLFLDITVWSDNLTEEQKNEMLAFKQDMDVVISGKLNMRTWNGRTYLGIDATAIE